MQIFKFILALLTIICINTANAHTDLDLLKNKSFFVGFSVDRNYFSGPETESDDIISIWPNDSSLDASGYSLIVGKRWDRLAAQVGYSYIDSIYVGGIQVYDTKIKYQNVFADAIFYYPLIQYLDLKASLGLGMMHSTVKGNYGTIFSQKGSFNMSRNQVSTRFGLGAEYMFASNLGMDFMVRYQKANFMFRNDFIVSVGIFYYFQN